MRYILAFLLIAASANAAVYNERPFISTASSGGGGSATVAVTNTQVPYGTGTAIASDPSLTYVGGVLSTYGLTTTGGSVAIDATQSSMSVNGTSVSNRGITMLDSGVAVGSLVPTGASGGFRLNCLIGNVNCVIRTQDSGGNLRGLAVYPGLGNSAGVMVSGNGFATPSSTLHVSGTTRVTGNMTVGTIVTPTTQLLVSGSSIITSWTTLNSTSTPTGPLVIGNLIAAVGDQSLCTSLTTSQTTRSLTCGASMRSLKKDFSPILNATTTIDTLKPQYFYWKDPARGVDKQVGFIADEVASSFPEAYVKGEDGIESVNKQAMVPLLVKAVQEMDVRVKQLEANR